jgi:leucyl aminopeptidase
MSYRIATEGVPVATNAQPKIATLSLKPGNALTAKTDALVVATTSDGKFSIVSELPKGASTKLRAALLAVNATGKKDEVVRIPATGIADAQVVVAVGLGTIKHGVSLETLRRAAGSAVRTLAGYRKVSIAFPVSSSSEAGAILEGAALGAYAFTEHRQETLANTKVPVAAISLFSSEARNVDFRAALERARIVATGVTFARNLINTSPLHLPPAELAREARTHLADTKVKIEVLDEKALAAGGYGGILGVGQGSSRPPRLIRMEYKPRGATKHVALIGKGITFDTGGISLKPPRKMHEMKADMSGAAAVIATIRAIHDLELPIAVTAYAACAENMPGGGAQRPGDVVSAYGGRTIEILNTDAEGRLVMADVLVRAAEDNPNVVIDIATLTGAAVVALGHHTAGVIGDEVVRDAIKSSADRAGEEFWPMPLPEELRPHLNSRVADIANIGIREGGMLSAGWFLKYFVKDGLPWAHLDIAGPAYNSHRAWGYTPNGGVGFGVRTMVTFIEDVLAGAVDV